MMTKLIKELEKKVVSFPYPTVFDVHDYVKLNDVKKLLNIHSVVVPKGTLCNVCNNDQVFETEDGHIADCPRCN